MNNSNFLDITTTSTSSIVNVESSIEGFKNAELKYLAPQLSRANVPVVVDFGNIEILDLLTINKLVSFKRLTSKLGCGFYINVNEETPARRQIEHAGFELSTNLQIVRKQRRA